MDFDGVRVEDDLAEDHQMEEDPVEGDVMDTLQADIRYIVQRIAAMEDNRDKSTADISRFINILAHHADLLGKGLGSVSALLLHTQARNEEIKDLHAFVVQHAGATHNEHGQLVYNY